MTLTERFSEYVRACFTGIWIESHEHQDAISEIAALCRDEQWQLALWDIESGFRIAGQPSEDSGANDPLAAIRAIGRSAGPEGTTVLVLQNFHRFLQSAEVVQAMSRQIIEGKQNRTIIVVISPVVQIPVELEKLFATIEHDLPSREQLAEIARGVATEEGELPEGPDLEAVLDAAVGLTRMEAENAFSLSLVRQNRITADAVWELKTQTLMKSGLLSLHRGTENFGGLGGMAALKTFCKRALLQPSRGNPLKQARGVLLLSPPGCGKSQFAKSLGNEVGRPVLILDVGSLMGSLVGQSEDRTRRALKIVDAMEPCVLMIDEVEKAFAGVGGNTDSGVSARMFGSFLGWLNDHTSDVFVVCTSNDIGKLPPEFGRSERFDSIFFLDLPSQQEKGAIWAMYRERFAIGQDQQQPSDDSWTGAEIKACCRLAALLDLPLIQAAQSVVPIAVTASESVDSLRNWASGRCLAAAHSGVYQRDNDSTKPRRRVHRDPSNN